MGLIKKVIGLGIVGALTVGGWSKLDSYDGKLKERYAQSCRPIVGEVIEEKYINPRTLLKNPEYDGLVSHSNETVKLGRSIYILKIKTDGGKLISVSVMDNGDGKKEALDQLIEVGSRVSFPRGNLLGGPWESFFPNGDGVDEAQTYFHERTQVGTRRAGWISVLED